MGKLYALFNLFRRGACVSDPALWKNGGITAAMLVPVILAVAKVADAFGTTLPVTEQEAAYIATGGLTLLHIVLSVVTSDKVGLPPKDEPAPPGRNDPAGDAKPAQPLGFPPDFGP